MNVLMIEDDVYKSIDLVKALSDIDITEVTSVGDLESALTELEKRKFDFILLDMYFPKTKRGPEYPMCGTLVLEWMNEHDIHLPVIVTSSVKVDMSEYDDVIGQIHYGHDDEDYKMYELVVICGLK